MLKNTQNSFLNFLDSYLSHHANRKKGQSTRSGYWHFAVFSGLVAVLLVVLLILAEWNQMHASLGLNLPLLITTLALAAWSATCFMRCIHFLRHGIH